MKYAILFVILMSCVALAADCKVSLVSELSPSGSNAGVKATYKFDCTSDSYVGQITNVRFQFPETVKDITLQDGAGQLIPETDDPEFYKLTKKDNFWVLSVNPRTSILIAPYGATYDLTVQYTQKNMVSKTDQIGTMEPKSTVVKPILTKVVQNTKTKIDSDIDVYTIILDLPDGSEIKEISQPCTVNENKFACDASDISSLTMQWREKAIPEQIAQKGWPWAILGIKSAFGKVFGGLL
ncbi:MAG: hypothetical protein ABH829_00030 [archaeon]